MRVALAPRSVSHARPPRRRRAGAERSVRPLGLNDQRTRAALAAPRGGAWCLPALAGGVPTVLRSCPSLDATLANFCLALDAAGIGLTLPQGASDPRAASPAAQHYLAAQLDGYVQRRFEQAGLTKANPGLSLTLSVEDEYDSKQASLAFEHTGHLDVFQVRPVHEALVACDPKLGGLLLQAINSVHRLNVHLYDFQRLMNEASGYLWYGADTDAELLETANEGLSEEDEKVELDSIVVTPSHLAQAFGPMAGAREVGRKARSPDGGRLTPGKARALVAQMGRAPGLVQEVAQAALAVIERAHARPVRASPDALLDWPEGSDYPDLLSASAFVVWDDPSTAFEVVEHCEARQQDNGMSSTRAHCAWFSLHDPATWPDVARFLEDHVSNLVTTWRLLTLLPECA